MEISTLFLLIVPDQLELLLVQRGMDHYRVPNIPNQIDLSSQINTPNELPLLPNMTELRKIIRDNICYC